jgi:hypothetical protein
LDKARASARIDGGSTLLSATADALALFLADLRSAVERDRTRNPGTPLLSAITGEPFTVESARTILNRIEEIVRREQRLVFVREASWVAGEIVRAAEPGDERVWARSAPALEKALHALEAAREKGDGLTEYLANLEMSFMLAPQGVQCPASVRADWEKIQENLAREGPLLEESLRQGQQ